MPDRYPRDFAAATDDAGSRLDQFLVTRIGDVSRARVQQLIEEGKIVVNGKPAKPSLRLKGGQTITLLGPVELPPLRAFAEDIPLDVVYEDKDIAVINKPAGMTVHAVAGASDDPRNRGTLVNALLHRFAKLSSGSDELRPGIVHRLDKETSGLLVVAKSDSTHRKLARLFAERQVDKRYTALVHGWPKADSGTIDAPVGRDRANRARMSIRGDGARDAVSHYKVLERIDSRFGRFALVDVKIETGRTHQIRVHMASLGHPVVGDTLYGAPAVLSPHTRERQRFGHAISTRAEAKRAELKKKKGADTSVLQLDRNFLHAASIRLPHPRTSRELALDVALPGELSGFLEKLRESDSGHRSKRRSGSIMSQHS
ncbi:MAG: RluA family pseudouridine synthase [Terriglobia bacterium]|jgi:23S rRNA pseudouridine1911/1915/1917 synthase|nr:RluA family pseudouridine synthase [Terriglobia bacterium]